MTETNFMLAGHELDWPLISAAGMTNHPDIEAMTSRTEYLIDSGLSVVTIGSWTLGDARGGNGYTKTELGWEHLAGDEYLDIESGSGYNAKGLPNPGTDAGMERIAELVALANSKGTELSLSLSPHSGKPLEELKEIIALAAQALSKGVLYVEVNLSCPNVPGRPPFFMDTAGVAAFNELLQQHPLLLNKNSHPGIYVKYGPFLDSTPDSASHVIDAQSIGGRVTSNTFGGQTPLTYNGEQAILVNNGQAGMSGPALKDLGNQQLTIWVDALRSAKSSTEVISVLGIDSGEEVVRRLRKGAAAVQLGSILYWPELVGEDDSHAVVEKIKQEIVAQY